MKNVLRLAAVAALAGVAFASTAHAECPRPRIYTCGPDGEFICIDGANPSQLRECLPPR